jgi:hypothetical protein
MTTTSGLGNTRLKAETCLHGKARTAWNICMGWYRMTFQPCRQTRSHMVVIVYEEQLDIQPPLYHQSGHLTPLIHYPGYPREASRWPTYVSPSPIAVRYTAAARDIPPKCWLANLSENLTVNLISSDHFTLQAYKFHKYLST